MNNNQFLLALLFLALIITNCNQESFVEEFIPNEGDGTDPEPPAQPPARPQAPPPAKKDFLIGWEDSLIYSSPVAPNFGKLLELNDISTINSGWSKKEMANNVKPMKTPPQPSQMGSKDKHYAVPHTIGGKTQDNVGRQPDVQQPQNGGVATGTGPIEVHMVYAEWCGHSKRALPAFDKLVNNQSVTTKSGRKVTFV